MNNKSITSYCCRYKYWKKKMTALLVFFMMLFSNASLAYAGMMDNTPTYSVVDYNYEMAFRTTGRSVGYGNIKLSGNISKMDKLYLPHIIYVADCCGNQQLPKNCYLEYYIDDLLIYRNDQIVTCQTGGIPALTDVYVDVRPYRTTNAKMDYRYMMTSVKCSNCGKLVDPILAFGGVYFYDYRGIATFTATTYTVETGGSITIAPSYNEYSYRYNWAIKYPEDNFYTLLKDGVNAKGLCASGVSTKNLTLSAIPYVAGGFDVGVFCYDECGSLPCGNEYPSICPSTHVTTKEPTPTPTVAPTPTVTLVPTKTPTPTIVPTKTPTVAPTPIPTNTPTATPTPIPTKTPTPTPIYTPVPTKTPTATPVPTNTPTPITTPTASPTKVPTPTQAPTKTPTQIPTPAPTKAPTLTPEPIAKDTEAPQIKIIKTIDKDREMIVVTMIGTDNVGLHAIPYSWDGGETFEKENQKGIKKAGKYYVALRDSSGNVKKGSFTIDSIELEKVIQKPSSDPVPTIIVEDTGESTSKEVIDVNKPSTTPTPLPVKKNESLDDLIKKKEEYVIDGYNSDKPGQKVEVKELETDSLAKKKGQKDKDDDLAGSKISDKDSSEMFERIKKNSDEYVISMGEKMAGNVYGGPEKESETIVSQKDSVGNVNDFSNEATEDLSGVSVKKEKVSPVFIILIVLVILAILFILGFILFFGVIILVEKETEYSMLSNMEGFKIPVAISFVKYKDGKFSVCFRELLGKYGVVYAKFGFVFAYVFENEKISITTKYKGENEKEIATEKIQRELIVGNKGGSGK